MLLGERRELVLRERQRVADLARADELDEVLLQEVEVERRVEVEDLCAAREGRESVTGSSGRSCSCGCDGVGRRRRRGAALLPQR